MKRTFTVVLLVAFVLACVAGIMVSTSQAGPPPGCWFECIDGHTYLCCMAPRPPWELTCTYVAPGC